MFSKNRKLTKNLAIFVFAVFIFSFVAIVPGSTTALAAYPVSDEGIDPDFFGDNTPNDVGYKIDEGGTDVNGTWDTGYGTLEISGDGTYFSWEFTSDTGYAVSAVYVKGGNGYHLYDYFGTGISSDGNLASPETGQNNEIAEISHLCFDFEELDPGSLEVTKVVYGPDDSEFVYPDFEITITGPSCPEGDSKTFSYPDSLVQDWDELIPGEYTITESDPGDDWDVDIDPETVTVESDETAYVTVTNTYDPDDPDPDKGSLTVRKVVYADLRVLPDFEITITGPSYPDGDSKDFNYGNGWEQTWTDLDPGDYTISETDPGDDWDVEIDYETVTVAGNENSYVTVTNTYDPDDPPDQQGDLVITKTVRRGDRDREFEFTVWIDDELYEGEYSVDGDIRSTSDGTLVLSDGESALIEGLYVGSEYRVTEEEVSRYTTRATGDEGTIGEGTSTATFTNTRRSNDGPDPRDPDDPEDPDEPIIVPDEPEVEVPVIPQPEPVIVPEEPKVETPMPKTGGYPLTMVSLGTLLLGLGVYLRRR